MFQQLEALVRASGKLQLVLKVDNDRMVVVVVPMGEGKEAALRQPLVLTGTAAELDEGFSEAIRSYSVPYASLSEQVAVTTAILQQAEKTHVSKAQKALTKGGKTTTVKAGQSPADNDEAEDEDDEQSAPTSIAPSDAAATAIATDADAGKSSGTDLFSLLS